MIDVMVKMDQKTRRKPKKKGVQAGLRCSKTSGSRAQTPATQALLDTGYLPYGYDLMHQPTYDRYDTILTIPKKIKIST